METVNKNEIWKDVFGYKGWYSVSNLGNIRRDKKTWNTFSGRILKPTKNSNGYLHVTLHKNKKGKNCKVHIIVARAFLGKKDKKIHTNHLDGIKTNNNVNNLEYTTANKNQLHAYRIGIKKPKEGINNGNAKLDNNKVIQIKNEYASNETSYANLARKYKVDPALIRRIVLGTSWKHVLQGGRRG